MPSKTSAAEAEPTISVVIAAYNAAATLARAVESVLEQECLPLEIVIVDDGSTDETGRAADSFGGIVRCLRQENRGVAAARNAGVGAAQGEWVAFLDADDWYYPTRIRRQRELIAGFPDVDFCVGNYDFCRPNGQPFAQAMETSDFGREVLAAHGGALMAVLEQESLGRLITDYFGHTLTFSLPRRMFLRLGGYPEGIRVGEDLNLLIRACAVAERVGVICEPLGAYIVHSEGLVRSNHVDAQRQTVRALDGLMRQRKELPAEVRSAIEARMSAARRDLASALAREGMRWQAAAAVGPTLLTQRSWRSLKDVVSVLWG